MNQLSIANIVRLALLYIEIINCSSICSFLSSCCNCFSSKSTAIEPSEVPSTPSVQNVQVIGLDSINNGVGSGVEPTYGNEHAANPDYALPYSMHNSNNSLFTHPSDDNIYENISLNTASTGNPSNLEEELGVTFSELPESQRFSVISTEL